MAYRKHKSTDFPMFARWVDDRGCFDVVGTDLTPTGRTITNQGKFE